MRELDCRRLMQRVALIAALALTGAVLPAAASAQTPDSPQTSGVRTDIGNDDNDSDWGWVGLLGLAGLLGLRRRDHDDVRRVDHVDTTRRP